MTWTQGARESGELCVLVVDDSAVVRQTMTHILQDAGLRVVTAPDPVIASAKMRTVRPDVIVLDLEMPKMDGMTFLRQLMAEDPLPVIICSAAAREGSEEAFRALEEGAVELIVKPQLGVSTFLADSASRLVEAVRAASHARLARRSARPRMALGRSVTGPVLPPDRTSLRVTSDKIIGVGASTGGTEALRVLLQAMPPDAPGIAIVQHMPEVFTRTFAMRLDRSCRIQVKEAEDGDRLLEGRALIAPGNRHMILRRTGAQYVVQLADGPPVSRHRPSVDVLLRSMAQAAGANAVGIIMTGMGDDGAQGLLEMRQAGAHTIAQDEATCIVFGMPREAIDRGAVDEVVPLELIAHRALRRACSGGSEFPAG